MFCPSGFGIAKSQTAQKIIGALYPLLKTISRSTAPAEPPAVRRTPLTIPTDTVWQEVPDHLKQSWQVPLQLLPQGCQDTPCWPPYLSRLKISIPLPQCLGYFFLFITGLLSQLLHLFYCCLLLHYLLPSITHSGTMGILT